MTQGTRSKAETTKAWTGIMKHQIHGPRRMRHRARVARAFAVVIAVLCSALEVAHCEPVNGCVEAPGDSP